jgi:hypothetical protein
MARSEQVTERVYLAFGPSLLPGDLVSSASSRPPSPRDRSLRLTHRSTTRRSHGIAADADEVLFHAHLSGKLAV